ncbi:DUF11 domain-containing protein [Nocardioides sp. TF02-7]|uniref:DUF11 domain-containing protein n=1 Tax=Nocardioides sp. TF02-7 TaxID=2917724 RepID=UPI001F05C8C7|nr:DUF11 domain-containing protein [Nocardioides sp. TF02-7]UMG93867.1 DUF11 domain-containing protein [Nocardioides sp. TF02-7]
MDPDTGRPCAEEEFGLPRIIDSKSVDPADRTSVAAGEELTYTLRFENTGTAEGDVARDDHLGMLLDDAELVDGPTVGGDGDLTAEVEGDRIEVRGTLGAGDVATVTYTVRVKSDAQRVEDAGDDVLGNFLVDPDEQPPTECLPEADEDSTCNPVPRIVDSKDVFPADRTVVTAGEELTYTLTFENLGQGEGTVARDDHLGMLLDDAELVAGPDVVGAPGVTAELDGDRIEVRGTLGGGDLVVVSYTVRVKSDAQRVEDGGDDVLGNFLIDPDEEPPTECLPTADEDSTCNPVPRIVDSKSVSPADGTSVEAGDELTYTLRFENLGQGDGTVARDDHLGMLLDDAELVDGPTVAGDGSLTATRDGRRIQVRGTLGAGDVATVTYTVRVKPDAQRVEDGGDDVLGNFLVDPDEEPPTECLPTADEDSTCNPVPRIVDSKSVSPADRTVVTAGEELTYTLRFENLGQGQGDVARDDHLGMLLDDAELVDGPTVAGAGALTAEVEGDRIEVRGTLGAGDVATVTYAVRVKPDAQRVEDGGDDVLGNFLIGPDEQPPTECLPEADEDSTCNPVPRIVDSKSVSPADRTSVAAGDELTYTLRFENLGQGEGTVARDDHLGMLLDDAELMAGPTVGGEGDLTAEVEGDRIEVRGTLGAGDVATVTYTVRVKSDADRQADGGDDVLGNFLIDPDEQPPTECLPAADEDSTCNPVPRIVDSKSVSPADGTSVEAGDELTYTLRFENLGQGDGTVARDDHLGMLLDDAELVDGPTVAGDGSLTATRDGRRIQVRGTLGAGDVATVTYTVRVKPDAQRVEDGDDVLGNFLVDPDEEPPTECLPTADEDSTCNPVRALDVDKTSDRTAETEIGDTVTYTVTAENVGAADYTAADPAQVRDTLAGVLDDATYNDDATADRTGTLDYTEPVISWEGALAVGETVTIAYTVTLQAGGDLQVRNVAWGGGGDEPACSPPTADGFDPDTGRPCAEEEFGVPVVEDSKSVDPASGTSVGPPPVADLHADLHQRGHRPGCRRQGRRPHPGARRRQGDRAADVLGPGSDGLRDRRRPVHRAGHAGCRPDGHGQLHGAGEGSERAGRPDARQLPARAR